MDNKIIEMKKENKVKKWFEDHAGELIATGAVVTFCGVLLAAYVAGVKDGKGPDVDEWVPAPYRTFDGKIGITMMGLKCTEDGGAIRVDSKDYTYEKLDYARNIANNILRMADEIEAIK